jgi:hypothetical protein
MVVLLAGMTVDRLVQQTVELTGTTSAVLKDPYLAGLMAALSDQSTVALMVMLTAVLKV